MPYSLHAFRVVACTSKGCGSSSLVKARTMEAQPEGFVTMAVEVADARTVQVRWTPPVQPNGDMYYDVYFEGLYYRNPSKCNFAAGFDNHIPCKIVHAFSFCMVLTIYC